VIPSDRNPAIPHELLLGQAGFLRRLARDLVRDPHAAEDALQDAWVAALEHPPRHDGNVRAWLGTILRNLVARRAQASDRRVHHESRAAREGTGTTASSASGESVRFVTDAVLALEEPYQSTILARYFEDLKPSEIATRQSVPIATVKSRLRRALEILRVRMKDSSGDSWRASLLALTLPVELLCRTPLAGAGKGVILMSLKTKLVIGYVALLAAALVYRGLARTPDPPSDPLASAGPVASAAASKEMPDAKAPLEVDSKPAERALGSAPTEAPAAAVNEKPQTLFYGSLLDPSGKPLTGLWTAGVSLTDADGRRRFGDAKDSGAFAFNALPYGKYWVSAGADGYHTTTELIDLDAAHAQIQKDFTLKPVPILKVSVVTPEGANLFDLLRGEMKLKGHRVLVPVATKDRPGKWFNERFGSDTNTFGIGQFWSNGPRVSELPKGYMGILMLDQELPAFVSLVNYHRVLQTKEVTPGEDEVRFVVSLDDLLASQATIQMQVLDACTQAPIPTAHASLWGGTYRDGGKGSDANGNIVFEAREPGEFDLHVSARDHEEYKAHIMADSGVTTDLGQILLDKEITLNVKVVDGSGAPRSELFSFGLLDPPTPKLSMKLQMYQSSGDGILKLAHLGRHVYVLRTFDFDAGNDEGKNGTTWVSGDVLLDLRSGTAPANFVITLVLATRVMLLVKSEPADGLRFRITDEQGLDLVSSRFYGHGPHPLTLPQGTYKVALLDANKTVLEEQTMTVGATPMTVELSR
jgi:RNA polymerase sigma-70 factor (ECF subfamily)